MKACIAIPVLALLPSFSFADTILGIYGGVRQWQVDFSGEVGDKNETATLDDLGYNKETSTVLWARFEHFVPLLPNIGVMSTSIKAGSSAQISRDFSLGGIPFALSSHVVSKIDLTHLDGTLYYEILDNWVSLDLGVTARHFSGYLEARSEVNQPTIGELEGVLPMLYASARFDLPLTGWHIGGQANGIAYDGDGVTDIHAQVGYELDLVAFDLGLNIGYRKLAITVENIDDLYADAEIAGAYAELQIHF